MKFKKYCTVFLAFIMYFNVFSQAHAAKNYNVKTIVYDPLEKVINATVLDQIAEKTMQKSAKVPVTAGATGSTVASMIRMGIAGAAIYGLIEGVGWIIENGVVKKPTDPEYVGEFYYLNNVDGVKYSSATAACNARYLDIKKQYPKMSGFKVTMLSVISYECLVYDTTPEAGGFRSRIDRSDESKPKPEYRPVSDTELGDKVNNSPQAPDILPTVYNPNNPAGGKAPQDTSDALDRAVPVPETDPTGSTEVNPETGKGTFKLPAFCEWASVMCAWYQKYQEDSKKTDQHRDKEIEVWSQEKIAREEEKQQREQEIEVWSQEKTARQEEKQHRDNEKSFWEKVTDFFDWAQKDPEKEDTEVDVDNPDQTEPDTTISFSTACPAKIPLTFNWNGQTLDFSFDFTIWCEAVSTFVYPIVVALGSLHALYIVAGVRQDG